MPYDLSQVKHVISFSEPAARSAIHHRGQTALYCNKRMSAFLRTLQMSEINPNLIDTAVRKWLVQEYGMPAGQSNGCDVPRVQNMRSQ
jgi:hypothetical protein